MLLLLLFFIIVNIIDFSYYCSQDVNEQNRWVSAIRKACLCNREMSPVHHTGVYQLRKKEWSCCRATAPAGNKNYTPYGGDFIIYRGSQAAVSQN